MAALAICLGIVLKLPAVEFAVIFLCAALVLALEMVNTAIEKLCNFVSPQYNAKIKVVKDIAAGAVLLAAIFSAAIGVIIFFPKIF